MSVALRAVATDCFSGKDLTKAMTYTTTAWALGPVAGPVIGGYLQHYFNWQADFYFFGLYGTILLVYIFVVLPETCVNLSSSKPSEIYCNFKRIVTHKIFLCGAAMLALVYAILVLFNVIGPFLIQNILKYSVVSYGNMALLLGLGYLLGSLLNRFLISYFKPTKIIFFATILGTLISIAMLFLGVFIEINIYIILIPTFLLFLLCALIFPNMTAVMFNLFPKQGGTTSAVYGAFIGLGVFIMTVFAPLLKTSSQIPMTFAYIGLFLCCLLFFMFTRKES